MLENNNEEGIKRIFEQHLARKAERKLPNSQEACYLCFTTDLNGKNDNCGVYLDLIKLDRHKYSQCPYYNILERDISLIALGAEEHTMFGGLAKIIYSEIMEGRAV
jgi:hypothetical protein